MSFIAKNPLSLPEITSTPSTPSGTRGLFPKNDGWYEVDSQNNMKKLATNDDIDELKDFYDGYSKILIYREVTAEELSNGLVVDFNCEFDPSATYWYECGLQGSICEGNCSVTRFESGYYEDYYEISLGSSNNLIAKGYYYPSDTVDGFGCIKFEDISDDLKYIKIFNEGKQIKTLKEECLPDCVVTKDEIADVAKKAIEISEIELDEVLPEDNNPVFYKVVSEDSSFVPYYVYAGVIHPVEGISGFVLYQYKLTPDGLFCRTGSYIHMMLPAFEWTDWQKIGEGGSGGAVSSVNNKTGEVVLTASDVGAADKNLSNVDNDAFLAKAEDAGVSGAVSSVNGQTGEVNLEIGDICSNLRISDLEFTYTGKHSILSILPSGSLVWDTSEDNVDADIMLVRYNGETHHLSRKANKDLSNVDNADFKTKAEDALVDKFYLLERVNDMDNIFGSGVFFTESPFPALLFQTQYGYGSLNGDVQVTEQMLVVGSEIQKRSRINEEEWSAWSYVGFDSADSNLSNVDNDAFLAKLNEVLPNGDEVSY